MGLPSLNLVFQQLATTTIARGTKGTVVLLLKDTVPSVNPIVMYDVSEVPKTLTAPNQKYISDAFIGYTETPKKVIAYIVAADATDYSIATKYIETIIWNYFAFPDIGDAEVTTISTWLKGLRTSYDMETKGVLPNSVSDSESVINFASSNIKVGTETYTAKQYCARMAGLLAGTPLNMSATYAVLPEVTDCDHLTKTDADTAIDAGKLILINDGRKVKVGRAVNSLTTTTDTKGDKFKKIKLIDIMDQIHYDLKCTIEDKYIGKYSNDYDHKILLISAIEGYFEELELEGLLEKGTSIVSIDIAAQRAYLKTVNYTMPDGTTADAMTDQQVKEANTEDKVFLKASITEVDAMEDVSFNVGV